MITIEFFHDIICSFCFPLSYRMRQLQKAHPDYQIIHRSFALVREPKDFDNMFGSRKLAKTEILSHWHHANKNDDLHRFNIEGMQKTSFDFPTSMPALIACKAAFMVGGNNAYWDAFDALQNALFVENLNIENDDIIKQIISTLSIDYAQWMNHYHDPNTLEMVKDDFKLVQQYQIQSVPCLIINQSVKISGAQSLAFIEHAISTLSNDISASLGKVCSIENGKMSCD